VVTVKNGEEAGDKQQFNKTILDSLIDGLRTTIPDFMMILNTTRVNPCGL
jgi:hypothetical protein